ncbi:MAG: gliding motility protein GldM [Bacteroidales bacterium]|nr:gliding motility protein GldM [Bacteroidales bacterium]
MAGYKETPRQKMISMMYLVLTAMLALNVSVEVLQAFVIVNESVVETNNTLTDRIDEAYSKFNEQYQINQGKVEPFWNNALIVKEKSDELVNYIDSIKYTVIAKCEKKSIEEIKDVPLGKIGSRDGYDVPTNYFIGQDLNKGEASLLKEKLEQYVTEMTALIPEARRSAINLGLSTDGDYKDSSGLAVSWETYHFYHTVLAADVTFLNKLIMDTHNAEYELINFFYRSVSADDFKFDKIDVKIIPKSNYVFLNDSYEAEILVVAYDTAQSPEVRYLTGVDKITDANIGSTKLVKSNGENYTKLVIPALSEGIQRFAGIVKMMAPNGDVNTYQFSDEFIVARPSMTVSATKMNVFYIGVDNPVSISVPGYGNAQITATISQGTLTKSGNGWNVRIPSSAKGNATITVSAQTEDGLVKIGSSEYRIKQVPNPSATIAGINNGNVDKNTLVAAGGIIPKMPEDFDFDLLFEITRFEFVGSPKGGDLFIRQANGGQLTDEMKTFIRNSKRGDKIWLENITAKGPDGNRNLGTISLQIQ